jgi:hypothetical protein
MKTTGFTPKQLNLLITIRGNAEYAKRCINEPYKANRSYYRRIKSMPETEI